MGRHIVLTPALNLTAGDSNTARKKEKKYCFHNFRNRGDQDRGTPLGTLTQHAKEKRYCFAQEPA